ncbi:hypothetical protein PGT21_028626 [Puccinia graminis f. sp. tritici]|uniref:Uncharacterized protein n=1 Tax=Puccinia graminis f. sp. tritici TaxID=56615 RepID=A0A5B0PKZ7_PUCGR|nr:hypothetical protein PGT21_028626 [Puccinia graminis f. sp. tritici]
MRQWRGHSHANAAHSRESGLALSSVASHSGKLGISNQPVLGRFENCPAKDCQDAAATAAPPG